MGGLRVYRWIWNDLVEEAGGVCRGVLGGMWCAGKWYKEVYWEECGAKDGEGSGRKILRELVVGKGEIQDGLDAEKGGKYERLERLCSIMVECEEERVKGGMYET